MDECNDLIENDNIEYREFWDVECVEDPFKFWKVEFNRMFREGKIDKKMFFKLQNKIFDQSQKLIPYEEDRDLYIKFIKDFLHPVFKERLEKEGCQIINDEYIPDDLSHKCNFGWLGFSRITCRK